jgi:hypothetical protein
MYHWEKAINPDSIRVKLSVAKFFLKLLFLDCDRALQREKSLRENTFALSPTETKKTIAQGNKRHFPPLAKTRCCPFARGLYINDTAGG